jgi:hypothetical protein
MAFPVSGNCPIAFSASDSRHTACSFSQSCHTAFSVKMLSLFLTPDSLTSCLLFLPHCFLSHSLYASYITLIVFHVSYSDVCLCHLFISAGFNFFYTISPKISSAPTPAPPLPPGRSPLSHNSTSTPPPPEPGLSPPTNLS